MGRAKKAKRSVRKLRTDKEELLIEVDHLSNYHLHLLQDGKCFYCGKRLTNQSRHFSPRGYDVDHVFPASISPANRAPMGNKVLSCRHCNEKKADRAPSEKDIERFLKIYSGIVYERKRIFNYIFPEYPRCFLLDYSWKEYGVNVGLCKQ